MQLCWTNPEFTNCSWDKYTNDKCDEGCSNQYCTGTIWGSNMQRFVYSADRHHCPAQDWLQQNISQRCGESES